MSQLPRGGLLKREGQGNGKIKFVMRINLQVFEVVELNFEIIR